MVVIPRILLFFLGSLLILTNYNSLLGMQAATRLLGCFSRLKQASKPIIPSKLPQPKAFGFRSVQKRFNTQSLNIRQRFFTTRAKSWQMPRFNTTTASCVGKPKGSKSLIRVGKTVLAATALQTYSMSEMPEFTLENIDSYPEHAEKFFRYLKEHPEFFEINTESHIETAIIHFLNKHPQWIYDISSVIVHRLEHASFKILDVLLQKIKSAREKGDARAEIEKEKFSKKACALMFTQFGTDGWARILSIKKVGEYIPEVLETVLSAIEQHAAAIPAKNIDALHSYLTPEQQRRIERAIKQKLGLSIESTDTSVIEKALLYHDTFSFLTKCTKENQGGTVSEKHYCANQSDVLHMLSKATYLKKMNPELLPMFIRLFKKEQEETAKGNYVFYHAQRWAWHFKADIYKQFRNLTQTTKVDDSYQFLRFDDNQEPPKGQVKDALFMNAALFGNAKRSGACSFLYLLEDYDFSVDKNKKFSTQWMAKRFKLEPYYEKHRTEFEKLEQLHDIASKNGNCLLISVPRDKVNEWVHTTDTAANVVPIPIIQDQNIILTSSAQHVIDVLKKNPEHVGRWNDTIEYAMPMEGDVLDPHKGPRIYAFNNADPKIMEAYRTKRDQLFATIKAEMDQSARSDCGIFSRVFLSDLRLLLKFLMIKITDIV